MSAVPVTPAAVSRGAARVLAPRLVLSALVLAGTVLIDLLTRRVVTPSVFPDEYLYSQLGRGLATTGHLTVRGVDPHFLPVLQPLLTAPLWLVGDVGTAFRLIQLENAFVLSLSAIPAYLIARRLGASATLAYGAAALTVCAPFALFTGMIIAEPFAYTLALAVVAATLQAIAQPSLRAQVVLLALAGLATFDRLQLAALPLCAGIAAVATGLRERRLRAALRENRLLLGVLTAGVAGGVAYASIRGLGYYHLHPRPLPLRHALGLGGVDAYIVLIAGGMAIVPSALVGLAQSIVRPRTRIELAFGALTCAIATVLLLQCILWGDVHRVQERYLGYLVPLLALSFVLRCTRADRRPVAEIGVAAGIAAIAVLLPLDGYAIDAKHTLAPTLYGFTRIELLVGSHAQTATFFALGATALAALGAVSSSFRRGPVVALAASVVVAGTLLVSGTSWSGMLSADGRANYLPADARWVDHADAGKATMLVVGDAWNGQALATLFWNPTVAHVVRMPGANRVDWLQDPVVQVRRDGTVVLNGRPVRGDVLVEVSPSAAVTMNGAKRVRRFAASTLWRPDGAARLGSIMNNRLSDGRVLRSGGIEVWSGSPRLAGWIELRVHAPVALGAAHLDLVRTGVDVPAGATRVVRVAACGRGPWSGGFRASPVTVQGSQWRSPVVSVPRYVPDPRACS